MTRVVRRPRSRVVASVVVAAVLIAAAGGAGVLLLRPASAKPAASAAPITVTVERTTLTDKLQLNAQLSYGDPLALAAASGTITALPAPGALVSVGQRVYEADGEPVVLLRGIRPFWRELGPGMPDGQDVLQLEQNLKQLGFFDREPDARFAVATEAAVKAWQKSLGVEETGRVALGSVIAVDAASIRVSQVSAKLGESSVSPLSYTATTLRAVAKLTAAQARELQPGAPVAVVLPDGTEIAQKIAAVDPGGQPKGDGEELTPPTASVEFADQKAVAAAGPVAVRLVVGGDEKSAETLVVPVTALLAVAEGGYAVEVVRGRKVIRIPVEIGLVADARVQIVASGPEVDDASDGETPAASPGDATKDASSPRLEEGDNVVVAK